MKSHCEYVNFDGRAANVTDLHEYAKDHQIPVVNLPIARLSHNDVCRHWSKEYVRMNNGMKFYSGMTIGELAAAYRRALTLDGQLPILVNRQLVIIDGIHRVLKAMLENQDTIRAIILSDQDIVNFFNEVR